MSCLFGIAAPSLSLSPRRVSISVNQFRRAMVRSGVDARRPCMPSTQRHGGRAGERPPGVVSTWTVSRLGRPVAVTAGATFVRNFAVRFGRAVRIAWRRNWTKYYSRSTINSTSFYTRADIPNMYKCSESADLRRTPESSESGFRTSTPGSGRWSGSSPKLNPSFLGSCPTPSRNFVKIRSQLFQLSDGQTDRQTNRPNQKHHLLRRRSIFEAKLNLLLELKG